MRQAGLHFRFLLRGGGLISRFASSCFDWSPPPCAGGGLHGAATWALLGLPSPLRGGRASTTVAIPRYDSGAVGNDTIALPIDADGAICSIPTPAPRRATPSALNAKTNAVSPPHSTRHQAPRRFEAQQTAHRRAFFFHHLQVGGPHGTQQRQRPHRQGDVTIPPRPTANLILI